MRIRLYLDEDTMDADLVHALRIRGVDVTTALEQRMVRRADGDHLECARSQQRTLYSFNIGDYQQLHAEYVMEGKHHAGIILARQQRHGIGEQMRRLLRIVARVSAEDMKDRVVFLSSW
ncbi:MAG TPA: DUF5615 family PIN-like protein [Blastocatellia bacterium]|nr:DUF5615 family PIN-like protein [Blastocatellia bacterium]